jgi:hypothetical protein
VRSYSSVIVNSSAHQTKAMMQPRTRQRRAASAELHAKPIFSL